MPSDSSAEENGRPFPEPDKAAVDDLFGLAYMELKRLASSVRRADPRATISPTTLVNEAYLKLSGSSGLRFESRLHFNRIAARAMRQILVEAARKRSTAKRGGDGHFVIAFDESLAEAAPMDAQIIALHEALDELAKVSPRQATIVESRFFGGLTDREIAEFLDVSEATVLRDWRLAKAFLFDQMNRNV